MCVSFFMTVITDEEKIEKYKFMKVELTAFLDGLTRGNWSIKDKFGNFFKHLEEMVFGKDISVADNRVL